MHKIICSEYYAYAYKTMHIILSIKYFKQYIVDIKYKARIAIAAGRNLEIFELEWARRNGKFYSFF